MISIGFVIKKDILIYVVLEKNNDDIGFREFKSIKFNSSLSNVELMGYFSREFNEILERHKADIVSYKVSLNVKVKQIPYLHYPYGILNYICYNKKLKCNERSSSWISGNKKKKQIIKELFNLTGNKQDATMIAYYGFEE